ncbi:MAG: aquaporin family protein [Sphingobacteriales bacterium]|nr:aquaporin family protein [Sphingobacteriales bacterium]
MGSAFFSEFVGTAILIVFGAGVVANVVLNKTKGNSSGWIVITFGWGMAVYMGVSASLALEGPGHLNPAVTIAMAVVADFDIADVLPMIAGQFAGAIAASTIIFIAYKQHFDETENKDLKLAVFCTAPAIRNTTWNLATEIIGTFILVLGASLLSLPKSNTGQLGALPVGLLVLAIGLSLGGPTGYAINPARDLGPRIAHFILPIKDKRDSDWSYSWIPVVGPIIGALLAVFLFKQF